MTANWVADDGDAAAGATAQCKYAREVILSSTMQIATVMKVEELILLAELGHLFIAC